MRSASVRVSSAKSRWVHGRRTSTSAAVPWASSWITLSYSPSLTASADPRAQATAVSVGTIQEVVHWPRTRTRGAPGASWCLSRSRPARSWASGLAPAGRRP